MCPSLTTTVMSACGGEPVASMTLTWVIARVEGGPPHAAAELASARHAAIKHLIPDSLTRALVDVGFPRAAPRPHKLHHCASTKKACAWAYNRPCPSPTIARLAATTHRGASRPSTRRSRP